MNRALRAPRTGVAAILLALLANSVQAQTPVPHPLDPLTASEITRAVSLLKESGRLTDGSRFGTITVQPQEKRSLSARAARIVGFDWSRNEGFLAVVDLAGGRVTSWTVVDSEPPMRLIIIRRVEEIAHADPRWIAAMQSRGIDTGRVNVLVGMSERAKLERRGTDRIVGAFVMLRDAPPDAMFVNDLMMVANLTQGTLTTFRDMRTQAARADSAPVKAPPPSRAPLKPFRIEQPAGSSVTVDGNLIEWDNWRLRVGVDPRRGLEIHDVSFSDAGRRRAILYSGSVSEIVAPYGDPTFASWYPRDEGDYGMGIYSMSSAVPLNDAPAHTRYLSATMHDARGRPIVVPRAIAVHERDGGILWRHANQSRRGRQLVISGFSTIDNYDYQFNWILSQDGTIEGEVVLSGIMNTNATARMRDTAHVDGHVAFGHLVAPGINAPNHQHFFSFRLDVDVDAESNTVYELNSQAPPREVENPKGEVFSMRERPLVTESAAVGDVSFEAQRAWRVVNTHATNALGQFPGYTLVPGAVAPAYALPGSAPRRMSGFVDHQLWVTPYAPDELYAAGEFQNLGRDGEGLPAYIMSDRNIKDADVVLWYTLGITHIARVEDWPYMPTHRGSFKLLPTSFFSKSPVLDVPVTIR